MIASGLSPADDLAVQQLRSFCIVFEKQSYSAAAREIGLSVPTIWEQVRGVEQRYGTVLFRRRGRRIQPTPPAALLYQSLRVVLAGLDSTFQLLREEAGQYPRTVTLVTGARMILEDLGRPLKRFRDRYPHVCLRLLHGNRKTAEELIVAGEADLGLTLEPGPEVAGEGVCYERAYQIDYLALLPKNHALARQPTLRLRDLAAYPLVVGHSGTYSRQLLEQALHREGLSGCVQIAAETDNSAFTIACARAGMGIGIVAGRARGFLSRDLVARSLQRQLGRAWIAFLWKKGRHLTATVQTLIQLIREGAEDSRS
ncbi:MAG TPA: LysR family transcriptional regulator [Gemmataceae bacterium]|nr:LysR family transcriptional regulator [Gemmataceae bacterium]